MKLKLLVIGILATATLSACGDSDWEVQRKMKLKDPAVNEIGIIEGCDVKYVDRGYNSDSFFIAKCGNTTTQTSNYTSGKSQARMTSITQQIDTLTAEKQALEKQNATRQSALSKLTPEERAALGAPATDTPTQ